MIVSALTNITLTGELAFRTGSNYSRLERPMYRPEDIFQSDQLGWPGDWEGRTILALSLHESLSGRKAAYLDEILARLQTQWNERGYLRQICPDGVINEQQLSGHNWLLRGLLERYQTTKEDKLRLWADRIVENLYLPLLGRFSGYPVAPGSRALEGGAAGHNTGLILQGWQLSSDIGCAFTCFDALAQYYQLFGTPALQQLLEEMFEAFSAIDVVESSVQVHATLSTLRGILRYYEASKQPRLLAFAQTLFDRYLHTGMTENYANYNWFGRPSWTEPCAIIDSYMVAVTLFRHTKKPEYIAIANKIYYNALLAAQRHNGGFGCDLCAGTEESGGYVQVKEGLYEAYWCCTMRGAEGLVSAAQSSVLVDTDAIYLTNYIPGEFRFGELTVTVRSRYPYENQVSICLRGDTDGRKLWLYLPENGRVDRLGQSANAPYTRQGCFVVVEAAAGQPTVMEFSTFAESRALIGALSVPEGHVLWKGDLIIGKKADGTECFLCDRIYENNEADMKIQIIR